MAEVQSSTQSGENAARFIEFVMMQAQNASLVPRADAPIRRAVRPEVNLDLARMFIDQLAMIGEKTRGNLSPDETKVLRNALTNLQMAYFEVAQGGGEPPESIEAPPLAPTETAPPTASAPVAEAGPATLSPEDGRESKKRFTKSYGS